ncbi:MAG: cupin domain-containing protein [Chloroflexi bacterium]|nr:cupin domain-containing protein [Chloroflexota bacterium]
MIHAAIDPTQPKGWLVGPWNSPVPIPIGYANQGIQTLHYHAQMYEVYLIAKGTSTALVNGVEVPLQAGDMLVVEPGEVHTFSASSPDYLHFVLQTPFVHNDKQLVVTVHE